MTPRSWNVCHRIILSYSIMCLSCSLSSWQEQWVLPLWSLFWCSQDKRGSLEKGNLEGFMPNSTMFCREILSRVSWGKGDPCFRKERPEELYWFYSTQVQHWALILEGMMELTQTSWSCWLFFSISFILNEMSVWGQSQKIINKRLLQVISSVEASLTSQSFHLSASWVTS